MSRFRTITKEGMLTPKFIQNVDEALRGYLTKYDCK